MEGKECMCISVELKRFLAFVQSLYKTIENNLVIRAESRFL